MTRFVPIHRRRTLWDWLVTLPLEAKVILFLVALQIAGIVWVAHAGLL